MKSKKRGKNISVDVEILNVSRHGVWLLAKGREYFLDYGNYPWFKDARVGDIFDVSLVRGTYLRWPRLDVDLELAALDRPESYPLVYQE